jgi:hypothetical protein
MQVMRSHGYNVEAISLASNDPKDPPNTDIDSDVEVITAAIENILSSGNDVVLVTHSYSGYPGQTAAYNFIDRQPGRPRIVAIAMMCSFLYPAGTKFIDVLGGKPHAIHKVIENETLLDIPDNPKELFYHDVQDAEAVEAIGHLKPASWRTLLKAPTVNGSGYWGIPTSYLICESDKAIPAELQRLMLAGNDEEMEMRESKMRIRQEAVDASHSPFLSIPDRTADFIRRSAGEDVAL